MFYIQYTITENGYEREEEFFAYETSTQDAIKTFLEYLAFYHIPQPDIFTISYEKA